jgi:hypothetical protein
MNAFKFHREKSEKMMKEDFDLIRRGKTCLERANEMIKFSFLNFTNYSEMILKVYLVRRFLIALWGKIYLCGV